MIREFAVTLATGMIAIMLFIMSFAYVMLDIPFIFMLIVLGLVAAVVFLLVALKRGDVVFIEQ